MNPSWGVPTRDPRTGHLGARMFAKLDSGGWEARYEVDSHGKTSTEIAAHLVALGERHDRWAARMTGLQDLRGVEIGAFRITGATIPPRSQEQHFLIVGVRRVDGENLVKVDGFPLEVRLRSIDECPTNEEILAMVTEKLGAVDSVAAAHEEFVAKVASKISERAHNGVA
jgi:hypothetical protein